MHWSPWGVLHLGPEKLVNCNQILSHVTDQDCIEFITARKRSLGQGNIFTSVCQEFCSRGEGVLSQHAFSSGSGGGAEGAMAPPSPVKISHKKDGHWRRPHRFHVSQPPLTQPLDPLLALQVVSQHALQQVSRGVPAAEGCLLLGGSAAGGVSAPRGCLVETPRDGYCCGRYASYWNAFLLISLFSCVGFV